MLVHDEERIALVTGANRGIGLEIARQLAERRHAVLLGARRPEDGERAAGELRAAGLAVTALPLDVTDEASVRRAAREVEVRFGRLDVLVNNAGVAYDLDRRGETLEPELIRATFDVNLFGLIAVTEAMLPMLEKSTAPRVVNVSSRRGSLQEAARRMRADEGTEPMAYFASKAAVNAVTLAFAGRLANRGGKVNAIAPGRCATEMTGNTGRSPADGARIAVAMATVDEDGPTGTFIHDDGPIPW